VCPGAATSFFTGGPAVRGAAGGASTEALLLLLATGRIDTDAAGATEGP
jgi:hypothetical protein